MLSGISTSYYFCIDIPEVRESNNKLQVLQDLKLIEALELCDGLTTLDYTDNNDVEAFVPATLTGERGLVDRDTYLISGNGNTDRSFYYAWKIEIAKKAIELLKST